MPIKKRISPTSRVLVVGLGDGIRKISFMSRVTIPSVKSRMSQHTSLEKSAEPVEWHPDGRRNDYLVIEAQSVWYSPPIPQRSGNKRNDCSYCLQVASYGGVDLDSSLIWGVW